MATNRPISLRFFFLLLIISLSLGLPASADSIFSKERVVTNLAEGVYTIRHIDPYPGWVHGNTTVIIGEREVFVVDSTQLFSSALEDIAQIRKWTEKPVRYVLNTHWHQDHNAGNKVYMDEFPGITIIAHLETKAMMDATSPGLSANMLKNGVSLRAQLQKQLESGKLEDGTPLTDAQRLDATEKLAQAQQIIEQARKFVYQPPTLTFDRELNIDIGNREVQVKHLGRGNTGGDAIVYLPKEKILVTGDLLVRPVPFAFDGYPSEWIQTLQAMDLLDATIIVPGHGEVLHDKVFLHNVIDLMKSIVAQVREQLRRNEDATLEEVQKAVDIKPFVAGLVGDDPRAARFLAYSMGSSFVEFAYHEAKQR